MPRANGRSPARGDLAGSKWCTCVPSHGLFGGLGRVVVNIIELHDGSLFV